MKLYKTKRGTWVNVTDFSAFWVELRDSKFRGIAGRSFSEDFEERISLTEPFDSQEEAQTELDAIMTYCMSL